MDNIQKQVRVRFSDLGEESQDDQYNIKGRIPPQKTVSFKGERKRSGKWFQKQFSQEMSDASDGDTETAIAAAAAAYAIAYMEQEGSPNQKEPTKELAKIPTKTKSKREDSMDKTTDASSITTKSTDTSKISRWLSGKEAKGDEKSTGERSMRKSATFDQRMLENSISNADGQIQGKASGTIHQPCIPQWGNQLSTILSSLSNETCISGEKSMRKVKSLDQMMLEDSITNKKMPEKATGTIPSIKKTPTFSDKYLNDIGSNRFDGMQYTSAEQQEASRYPIAMKSRKEETKADIWEKEQIAKIRKWYEKVNSKILQWENEKKMKAKHRMERRERELEKRRARYLQEYRNEISRIDKIASGARATSKERKRNKELKTKEKAIQLKSTRKFPCKCFCF